MSEPCPTCGALPCDQAVTPPSVAWLGWAIEFPDRPLFVQYGGDEAGAWKYALGWPSDEEIAHAKSKGTRAFRVQILEYKL